MAREKPKAGLPGPTSGELRNLLRITVDEMHELLARGTPDVRLAKLPPKKPPARRSVRRRLIGVHRAG